MKHLIAATAIWFVMFASQASALSCLRPDVTRTFHWAAEAEDSYVVLLGSFTFTMPEQTSTDINFPDVLRTRAQFSGRFLGAGGFEAAPTLDIALEFSCLAAWCGSLPDAGAQTLAFVKMEPTGYTLSIGPCYGEAFVEPSAQDVGRVEACMRGEGCAEAQ